MRHNFDEFLGVDVGEAKTGIARGSSAARLAQPLKSVAATDAIEELSTLAGQYKVSGLVVGLPRGLEAQETDQTKRVRAWTSQAKSQLNLPFYWQDEALTSQKAESLKLKAQSRVGLDAVAAALILQDFLDTPESQRVRC
ncbi:MAG TPA: Holliday junction resolvase RuvX [Candidatus Saccharimonadales bacterium]|nr:Holliday junction resolvase RuvX [Candidatus Saccharimonadales bacterium]